MLFYNQLAIEVFFPFHFKCCEIAVFVFFSSVMFFYWYGVFIGRVFIGLDMEVVESWSLDKRQTIRDIQNTTQTTRKGETMIGIQEN